MWTLLCKCQNSNGILTFHNRCKRSQRKNISFSSGPFLRETNKPIKHFFKLYSQRQPENPIINLQWLLINILRQFSNETFLCFILFIYYYYFFLFILTSKLFFYWFIIFYWFILMNITQEQPDDLNILKCHFLDSVLVC